MKIIGHRGASGLAPENTLLSFSKALKCHTDILEFDLRVTKDGIVVLHHNPNLRDQAGNKLILKAHNFADLKQHKPDLLTFESFLKHMSHDIHLLIEIKPGESITPIIKILNHELANGRPVANLSIGSFDQSILIAMHHAFPTIEKIVIEKWSGIRARLRARQVGTKRLNMRSWWLWTGFLRPMHKRGWQIAPYTMNDPHKVEKWQPYIYGVVTDYPDRFKS